MNKTDILVINPGSTSTKIAIYQTNKLLFTESINHHANDLKEFSHIIDQFSFRLELIKAVLLEKHYDMSNLYAISARGGLLRPIESGTYLINQNIIDDLKNSTYGEHASNLGALIAYDLASKLNIPSYITDPVVVDEMSIVAKYTGLPHIKRKSIFHALNHKAVGRLYALDANKPYESLNLIICHLGGGISVAAHQKGRIIDVNNALDGDGPMSPERSGSLPFGDVFRMGYDNQYSLAEFSKMTVGGGGLVAYLGTNDGRSVMKLIESGNQLAADVFEAMCYQITKSVGAMAAVLKGAVDAIIITGGLSYIKPLTDYIKTSTQFIAPVFTYPGEDEMSALLLGVLRVKNNIEQVKIYGGTNENN